MNDQKQREMQLKVISRFAPEFPGQLRHQPFSDRARAARSKDFRPGRSKGYSQLALSQPTDYEHNTEYFSQINQAAGRASSLVSQLLAFSRKQILQPRVVNLNDIVTNIQGMLGPLIGEDVEVHARLCITNSDR